MDEFEQITENGKKYVWAIDDNGYDSQFKPLDYDVVFKGTPIENRYIKKLIATIKAEDILDVRKEAKHWGIYVDSKLLKNNGGKLNQQQLQMIIMRAKINYDAQYDRNIQPSSPKK